MHNKLQIITNNFLNFKKYRYYKLFLITKIEIENTIMNYENN